MRKFFREQWKTSYPENRLFYSIYSYFLITSKKTKKKEITTFLDTNKCLMEKWKICKIHKKMLSLNATFQKYFYGQAYPGKHIECHQKNLKKSDYSKTQPGDCPLGRVIFWDSSFSKLGNCQMGLYI